MTEAYLMKGKPENGNDAKMENGKTRPSQKKEGTLDQMKSEDIVNYLYGRGHPHPISEGVSEMRELLLDSGFDEIYTSFFVSRRDLRELTGELYPVLRDSVYHLSWVRPAPLGPTPDVDRRLMARFPDLDRAELWNILDALDEDSSGEELLAQLMDELGLDVDDALTVMNMIPELNRGDPEVGDMTLRSFMPTSWLSTLEAIFDPENLPLRLFTVATAFRREAELDSSHIRTYNILSLAIGDDDLTLEKGMAVLRRIFDNQGLSDISFLEKSYQFPFFEKGTEIEIFGGDLELGTCGMCSGEILSSRGVTTPVFIADIGVERVLMHRYGYPDIRQLLYPQFFAAWNLTDEEIASSLRYLRKPQTDYGREIARAIHRTYRECREKEEDEKRTAWKGILASSDYGKFLVTEERAKELGIDGRPAEVVLRESRKGMGLCGPGAFNEIWVDQGNVVSVPPNMAKTLEERGASRTNKTFVKAFSRYAAWKIERSLERGHTSRKVEKIRDLEGINLKLTSKALYYILSHKKKVDVQGPVYLSFSFRVKDPR
ncbi:hypothetical protein B6U90_06710 [Thermoplasmatales archaeon ex4484_6]|nr:MAG: hypothetical protein B6U90_06710 [Thermoplasmatales archaeon ex4484_6]RLF67897.1 MAG: hypothetical protein DRN57_05110 [Thermoplasmata archaeon]